MAPADDHGPDARDPSLTPHPPMDAVLVIGGPLAADDVPRLCAELRRLLETHASGVIVCDVRGVPRPDVDTIHVLARLQLTARRLGARVLLRHASDDLRGLLSLVGLAGIVPCVDTSGVQPRRQPEHREEPLGVEEERDPADPAV